MQPSPTNLPTDVLSAWIALEVLSPQTFRRPQKEIVKQHTSKLSQSAELVNQYKETQRTMIADLKKSTESLQDGGLEVCTLSGCFTRGIVEYEIFVWSKTEK